jgi:hypothetical protein
VSSHVVFLWSDHIEISSFGEHALLRVGVTDAQSNPSWHPESSHNRHQMDSLVYLQDEPTEHETLDGAHRKIRGDDVVVGFWALIVSDAQFLQSQEGFVFEGLQEGAQWVLKPEYGSVNFLSSARTDPHQLSSLHDAGELYEAIDDHVAKMALKRRAPTTAQDSNPKQIKGEGLPSLLVFSFTPNQAC